MLFKTFTSVNNKSNLKYGHAKIKKSLNLSNYGTKSDLKIQWQIHQILQKRLI